MNKKELQQEIIELKEQVNRLEQALRDLDNLEIWKPKNDEKFYYIDSRGDVGESAFNCVSHEQKVQFGNFYKAKYEAEFAAQRQKYTNLYRKYVEEHSEPLDWKDSCCGRYFGIYNHHRNNIDVFGTQSIQDAFQIYASSEQVIKDAIAFIGEENMKKYIFGVTE